MRRTEHFALWGKGYCAGYRTEHFALWGKGYCAGYVELRHQGRLETTPCWAFRPLERGTWQARGVRGLYDGHTKSRGG